MTPEMCCQNGKAVTRARLPTTIKKRHGQVLDFDGVGKLVEMGVRLGRKVKPNLEIGVCGETGGEPRSIEFYHKAGLNYVSCSKFRVPIARLAAAQATIREKQAGKKKEGFGDS